MRLLTRPIPRGVVPFWTGIVLDTMDQRADSMAAVVHGLFFGRVAPSSKRRRAIAAPALVVGHARDPIHPAADAAMLADELPDATFVKAKHILEWRFSPDRLNRIAVGFALRCWSAEKSGSSSYRRVTVVPAHRHSKMSRCLSTETRRSCCAPTSWPRPTGSSRC